MKKIDVKYFKHGYLQPIELKKISVGDWIDLSSAVTIHMKKGEFKLIPLGVGMVLPKGYEALVVPRSSTFKRYNIIMTNSIGIIDNSYCGNADEWHFPAYAIDDCEIVRGDRIAQFRVVKNQPSIMFNVVDRLADVSRGGFGSTGR